MNSFGFRADAVETIFHLTTLLQGWRPTGSLNGVFIFGRAVHDFESGPGDTGILETAAELHLRGLGRIVLPNQEPGATHGQGQVLTSFPGTQAWKERLIELGVGEQNIAVTGPHPAHTRGEGDAFVEWAKRRHVLRAAVVMHPHQVLRAMLGLLQSFKHHDHHMRIFPVTPPSVNWHKPVYGSQGAQLLPRREHIVQEWRRVLAYQQKGDLASFDELYAYLTAE